MRSIVAFVVAGVLACASGIVSATGALAQSGPANKSRTLHFTNGLAFDIPPGWRFSELSPGGVTLHHGTDDKAFAKDNRNAFSLHIRLTRDADVGKGYDRFDRQSSRAFPNGTKLEWYAGPRYRMHYGFSAQIENSYRNLVVTILDRPTPSFSVAVVEQAMLAIAGSVRRTEFHRTFFHPAGMQAPIPNETWFSKSSETALRFGCFPVYCGKDSNTWLYAYRSAAAFKTDDEALKDITGHFAKSEKIAIGKPNRVALGKGVLLWTEQPGTARPFLGIVRQAGQYFFVSAFDLGTVKAGTDAVRPHFLQLGAGLRTWDGR